MGHENAEGMAHVGVRLTAQLGAEFWLCIGNFAEVLDEATCMNPIQNGRGEMNVLTELVIFRDGDHESGIGGLPFHTIRLGCNGVEALGG